MNKRIRELKEQATRTAMWPGDPDAGELDAEKFAELIVRECAELAEQKYGNWYRTNAPGDSPIVAIKQHFGVEE